MTESTKPQPMKPERPMREGIEFQIAAGLEAEFEEASRRARELWFAQKSGPRHEVERA